MHFSIEVFVSGIGSSVIVSLPVFWFPHCSTLLFQLIEFPFDHIVILICMIPTGLFLLSLSSTHPRGMSGFYLVPNPQLGCIC